MNLFNVFNTLVAAYMESKIDIGDTVKSALAALKVTKIGSSGGRLGELLNKWCASFSDGMIPKFHYFNFRSAVNVRIRPSFKPRVLQKVSLLVQQGWLTHEFVVARALPGSTDVVGAKTAFLDTSKECLELIDGFHRVEAVGLLEAIGHGPSATVDGQKWMIPTIVLSENCSDETCRSIAWALTAGQEFSHPMTSIDILHTVNTIALSSPRILTKDALYQELHSNMEGRKDGAISKDTLNLALRFYKCVSRLNGEGTSCYMEILRLGCQDHTEVQTSVYDLDKTVLKPDGSRLSPSPSCFLPMWGSGNRAGGGFVPADNKQKILTRTTEPDIMIALYRRAYGEWIMSGGDFMTRDQYQKLVDNTTTWVGLQKAWHN